MDEPSTLTEDEEKGIAKRAWEFSVRSYLSNTDADAGRDLTRLLSAYRSQRARAERAEAELARRDAFPVGGEHG